MTTPLEHRRRVRRRWLLWATLPVWLTVLVLGLHLALMNVVAAVARGQYADGQIGSAALGFTWLKSTDPVEQWKAPFDLGTTFTKGEDAQLGSFYLTDALELAPQDDPEIQCMVLINYAIAMELLGDEELAEAQTRNDWADEAQGYVDQGQAYPPGVPWGDATPEEIRVEAQEYAAWAERDYAAAQEARAACEPEGQDQEQQQENSESQERLEDKQQQAQDEEQPEQPEDQTGQSEEEKRQQELLERNEEAQAEAERQRQEEQGDQGGSGTKNW